MNQTLHEQQLIDAICLFHAHYKRIAPSEVEAELCYDEEDGYTAIAYVGAEQTNYATGHFIAAIRLYIEMQLREDPMAARIQFDIDDTGMVAYLQWS